jgi:diguanylate cyclase (GGDEF)-like protein/PAS domain S-box-containing protein
MSRLQSRLDEIIAVNSRSLSRSLWALDVNQLQDQLDGILSMPSIRAVEVREIDTSANSFIVSRGVRPAAQGIVKEIPLLCCGEKQQQIGVLHIEATLTDIYRSLLSQALIILLSNAVKTFLVAMFILFIMHRLIIRHLLDITVAVSNTAPGDDAVPLRLRRARREDELEQMVDAINVMREKEHTREHETRTLIDNSSDTISRYNNECRRIFVNIAFGKIVDGGMAALLGKTPTECPGGPNADLYEAKIRDVFETGLNSEFELSWTNKDGREIYSHIRITAECDKAGKVVSVLTVGRDITELYEQRKQVYQLAFYDSLTSLPNRALFNDRLNQMITDASWHKQLAGVMLLDLDRFKVVNDTLGHPVGDKLLCEAAARLGYCVRGYDTVARLGGDEFAILLPEIRSGDDLGRVANKIVESFNEPFLLDGKEVFVTTSIGISVYPADSEDADDLLKQADSAMYFAKRSGRNNFRFYSKDLTVISNERLMLEGDLRRGFGRGELELYYQPKVRLADGSLIGSEALLRWNHPQRGIVPPDKFIPIAEDSGLIVEIGEWVLHDACRSACEWNDHGKPLHKVAINLSARQFQSNDLVNTVRKALNETHCHPEWIELEITESLLLDEDGEVLETLKLFRKMGITIAIDDFGTGYSSLSYLSRFPIDTLKIDRSFISKVTDGGHHSELVKAIISIAHSLDQKVVAEGVETAAQASMLKAYGCYIAQGYFYSKPVPKAVFEGLPRMFNLNNAPQQ